MRVLVSALILIVNLIFQSTLFEHIAIMGIKPNTAIIIVVSFAFLRGETEGLLIGAFAGLLQDSFFAPFIGLNVFISMLIGYLCGRFFSDFYKEGIMIPMVITIVATFTYEFIFYIFYPLLMGYTNFLYFLNTTILPETVYTTLFSVVIYKIIYSINLKLEKRERYNRKLF